MTLLSQGDPFKTLRDKGNMRRSLFDDVGADAWERKAKAKDIIYPFVRCTSLHVGSVSGTLR